VREECACGLGPDTRHYVPFVSRVFLGVGASVTSSLLIDKLMSHYNYNYNINIILTNIIYIGCVFNSPQNP